MSTRASPRASRPCASTETPYNVNAAHLLGYLGPVNDTELADQKAARDAGKIPASESLLRRTDLVGRAGLEAQYDEALRGKPGIKQLAVDQTAAVVGTVGETQSQPGDYLVTNIDARLQAVVETELQKAIDKARNTPVRDNGVGNYKADSGAALVMDVTNGHVIAMASYPTYDPSVWVGGITSKEYDAITSEASGYPLISRAMQGQFVPASTFKIVSASAALQDGYSTFRDFNCPSFFQVGDRKFSNFESESFGSLTMAKGLAVSCDTMCYEIAYEMWLRDGALSPIAKPQDPIETMARAYGYGKRTGIDLPSESRGHVGGRAFKQALYDQLHDAWCKRGRDGYPEVAATDPARARLLQAYAKENCIDGDQYRGGDAVNLAIGQGDTVATPLQVAQAYAAMANGGTIWQPQVAKGVISSSGKVVSLIKPKKMGTLPVTKSNLTYLRNAFSDVTSDPQGTGYNPFKGFPLDQIPVGAKTGTGQAGQNKQSTSWFASFAPANNPKYAVVVMVSQGGTGASTSAPSVRRIYEAIYGISGSTIDPTKSVLVGGAPSIKLPTVRKDGTPVYPNMPTGTSTAAATTSSATPGPSDGASPDPASSGTSTGFLAVPPLLLAGLLGRGARRRRRSGEPLPDVRLWSG